VAASTRPRAARKKGAVLDPDPERALKVLRRLKKEFPDAKCALEHETPHQLLVATILSAQCTDARVNLVTKSLFRQFPNPEAYAHTSQADMEAAVKTTGFFRNKARALIEMSQDILTKHGGEVPRTMDELTALRGVGRKTANVILGNAFGIPGLVVDTHVRRLSNRLGFTEQEDPVKIEAELSELFPKSWWTLSSHLLILHGRKTCAARKARCGECAVRDLCPSADQV
jgi:endonuclease-3